MRCQLFSSSSRSRWNHFVIIAMVVILSLAPWAGANSTEDSDEFPATTPQSDSPVEISQPEPTAQPPVVTEPPTETVPVVPTPAEPDPIPTPPVQEEPEPVTPTPAPPVLVDPEPPVPTEPDIPVTAVPTEPEPVVTEPAVAPLPTDIPPTAAPSPTAEATTPTEVSLATSVSTPTESPTTTPIPTQTAVATPEPTSTPIPVTISWSQPSPVQCVPTIGNAQSLAFNGTATWRCEATIHTDFTGDLPTDLAIIWMLFADYSGDVVSITVLDGYDTELIFEDSLPAANEATVAMRSLWVESDVQTIAFEVEVSRTSCDVGSNDLRLRADPQFETATAAVQITRTDAVSDPPIVATVNAAENGNPTVRFDGPIIFESVAGTSAGLISPISRGTAVIVVEGSWNPCYAWTVNLGGTVDVPQDVPAYLRVVSINEEPLPGGVCDLAEACDLIALPQTGSAATPLRYTIGLELQLHGLTPAGNFGIGMQTGLDGVETQP